MPNFSGIWTVRQQYQAKGQTIWPATPGAPTIGTATAGSSNCASVTFTAPSCTGYPAGITGYQVTSTPGCFTGTGTTSPIVVSGLTNGTSYTFKAKAQNANGYGPCSAASNSVTPVVTGSQSYTTAGTYTWVAPSCVTSVSVVVVGGGGARPNNGNFYGGAGGGLAYKNNITVVPGNSYNVVVGAGGLPSCYTSNAYNGGCSIFGSNRVVASGGSYSGGSIGGYNVVGCGGGTGGTSVNDGTYGGGGGGAAGYSGNGGNYSHVNCGYSNSGTGGGGGGGNVSYGSGGVCRGGGGGGVGLFGQGSNGAGGYWNASSPSSSTPARGGSSGGCGGVGATPFGGAYGGGGGWPYSSNKACAHGGGGAVRIVWPGNTRTFPSTNVGSP